jgi:ABC-2 type transport system ATP-binding protein
VRGVETAAPGAGPGSSEQSRDLAVSCRGLVKSFGDLRALDRLDLQVAVGEVHGFLGPNGSGKTVTMRILLGLLRPDQGSVRLLGGDPWRDAVALHRRLAYVPGETNLWPNLTGGEVIDLMGSLRGGLDRDRRDQLVARFDLDPTKKARAYSKGNRQKVALVAALATKAELLILDEPTSGLDPLMEAVFQECVLEARDEGRTVLLSSHILAEVERLCDRVTIIRRGRAVESGSLDSLRSLSRLTITAELLTDGIVLSRHHGVHDFTRDGHRVTFEVEPTDLPDVVKELAAQGVVSLECQRPTLESLFLRHYAEELNAAGLNDAGLNDAGLNDAGPHAAGPNDGGVDP